MILATCVVIAVLFGTGAYLLLERDTVKIAAGSVLVSNSVLLFLVSAGVGGRAEPIAPLAAPEEVADPLAQALALTAVVIGFGITALLLRVALAVERSHRTIDVLDLAEAEAEETSSEEDEERR